MTVTVNATAILFNDSTTQITSSAYVAKFYTSPATWSNTKPGLKAVKITAVGAGGGGAPAWGNTSLGKASAAAFGGGGGAGAQGIAYIDGPVAGTSQPVTVSGTGGSGAQNGTAASFGSLFTAAGGQAGPARAAAAGQQLFGPGGTGGTVTAAPTVTNFIGYNGGAGDPGAAPNQAGGGGDATGFQYGVGSAPRPAASDSSGVSVPALYFSAGASGAGDSGPNPAARPGGTGGKGYLIVEEFY